MFNWTETLDSIPEYPFSRVGALCRELEQEGRDIINARIGIPDQETFPALKASMLRHLEEEDSTYGYPCDVYPSRGIPEFIDAIQNYYRTHHDVELEDENIAVVSWTKDVLHNLPRLFTPSTVMIPDPVYPTYASASILAGHEVMYMPPDEIWRPDLGALSPESHVMFLCDPNNPTGSVLGHEYYKALVDRWDGVLIADKAYKDFVFDDHVQTVSITEIPGLLEHGFEVVSFSKHYNLVGVGLGWIVGSEEGIDKWLRHASYRSQGVPVYMQRAGVDALTNPQVQREREDYMRELRERRDLFVDGLNGLGLRTKKPSATPYLWIKTPSDDDQDFVLNTLIRDAGVAFMPGSYFGESGKGYCRATIFLEQARIEEALERIEKVRS